MKKILKSLLGPTAGPNNMTQVPAVRDVSVAVNRSWQTEIDRIFYNIDPNDDKDLEQYAGVAGSVFVVNPGNRTPRLEYFEDVVQFFRKGNPREMSRQYVCM